MTTGTEFPQGMHYMELKEEYRVQGRNQSAGGNKDNNHHSYVFLAGTSKCESVFISDSSFGHPANSLTQLQQVILSSVCKIGRDWNSENLSNLLK